MLAGLKTKIAIGGYILCEVVGFLQPELSPALKAIQEIVFIPMGAYGIYDKIGRSNRV